MEITNIIHLLPDSVANQIAAGEVIQRPASVVKELVENAIDAGATSVQIAIKDAGRTLIQVIDNGCGMSVTDARMAFERHATSKISQAVDLYSLHTMGFRGEALPSIAAVAEIEMRTMRRDDTAGTRIRISASRVESQEPDVCTPGTNIMVKRLFFNLPARRKFLKKDAVEFAHIAREFERLALVNTGVEFTLVNNETVVKQLPAATLKKRICDLFGSNLDHQLIPISTETSLVGISGFVCLPQYARKRNALQYFFVNGRNMRHPYFHKAVLGCYESLIPADAQPCYFINLTVDPQTIDVNIHPQKHEIKFENEQPIWQILSAAIRESLGRFNASSAIDFEQVDAPDIPAFNPMVGDSPVVDYDPAYNPFATHESKPAAQWSGRTTQSVPKDWDRLYDNFKAQSGHDLLIDEPSESPLPAAPALIEAAKDTLPMFQLKGRYIVSPAKSGLMLVDQHRAHVLVLYEQLLGMAETAEIPSQRLIFPDSVTLEPNQDIVAQSIIDMLATMGYDVSPLGNNAWAINAVPSMLGNASPAEAFVSIVNAVSEADQDVEQSQWQRIALSTAKSGAIKYGAQLTEAEMDRLISDLFRLPAPDYTPDGKKTLTILSLDQIHKMF